MFGFNRKCRTASKDFQLVHTLETNNNIGKLPKLALGAVLPSQSID